MGNIGNNADVEFTGSDPFLRQAVRGRLQHHVSQASRRHLSQVMLHIRRLGRGDMEAGVDDLVANDRVDGRDNSNLFSGMLEDGIQQVRGGRLAVRAGNANDGQFASREIIKGCRTIRQRLARICYLDIRDVE